MTQIHLKEQCVKCKRLFKTLRELNQHTRMQRKPTIQILLRQHPQFFSITNVTVNEEKTLNADNDILKNKFDYMYNMIVHWRKSLFLLLSDLRANVLLKK